jgi:hypothetical protein
MFEVNSNPYILRMEFADKPLCVYSDKVDSSNPLNAKIRIKSLYAGVKFGGSKVDAPVAALLLFSGLITEDMLVERTEPNEYSFPTRRSNIYIEYKGYKNTPFDKLITKSFEMVFSLKHLKEFVPKIQKLFESFTFGPYYRFLLNDFESSDTEIFNYLLRQGIDIFNKGGYKNRFYTVSQKRIKYWDQIVEYLLTRLEIMLVNYKRSKTINKVNIDKEMLLKWLVTGNPIFEYVPSLDNPLREINMKETIVITIRRELPLHYLSLDLSYENRIDPINTPDNEKLGKVQRLAKTVELDELGNFI